jgi:hypothetical protein
LEGQFKDPSKSSLVTLFGQASLLLVTRFGRASLGQASLLLVTLFGKDCCTRKMYAHAAWVLFGF